MASGIMPQQDPFWPRLREFSEEWPRASEDAVGRDLSTPQGTSGLALLQVTRPLNCLLAAAAVVAGMMLVAGSSILHSLPPQVIVFAPLAAAFIAAFGNVFNDVRDVEVDGIAHPERPLPSQRLSRRGALLLMVALLGMGLASSLLAGSWTFFFALATVGALSLYEMRLKVAGLLGNAAISALTASTFLFGAVATGLPLADWRLAAVAALMAFLLNLAREVAKDIEDVEADQGHRNTLPMRVGKRGAGLLAATAGLLAILASLPFFDLNVILFEADGNGPTVTAALVLLADLVTVAGCGWCSGRPGWAQRSFKVAMALALLGFLLFPFRFGGARVAG